MILMLGLEDLLRRYCDKNSRNSDAYGVELTFAVSGLPVNCYFYEEKRLYGLVEEFPAMGCPSCHVFGLNLGSFKQL